MPKSYSTDLRECVLRSIEEGQSKSAAHRTFHISRSTIDHWLSLREQTGSLAPRAVRRTCPPQLHGAAFGVCARSCSRDFGGDVKGLAPAKRREFDGDVVFAGFEAFGLDG